MSPAEPTGVPFERLCPADLRYATVAVDDIEAFQATVAVAGMVRHSLANVPPANVSVDYAHELGISIVSKPTGETKTETISGAS
jgi:hypothetical protein